MNTLTQKIKPHGHYVAAALLGIDALRVFYYAFISRFINGYNTTFFSALSSLILITGMVLVIYPLVTNRNKHFLTFGFSLTLLHELLTMFTINYGGNMLLTLRYSPFRSFLSLVFTVLIYAAYAVTAALAAANTYELFPNRKEKINHQWYIPGVLFAGVALFSFLLNIVPMLRYGHPISVVFTNLFNALLFQAIPYTLVIVWMLGEVTMPNLSAPTSLPRRGNRRAAPNSNSAAQSAPAAAPNSEMHIDLFKHILLMLFTFGIWYYIWVYRTTKHLNCLEDEPPRNPTATLLLCLFVPFYYIYWIYKSAQRIDKLAAKYSIPSNLSTLCLILAILIGIVPPILMQEKMNAIALAMGGSGSGTPSAQPSTTNTADELKKYKELLDLGVITREEFEAKKRELLNL